MKYFVLSILCIAATSAQYHGSSGSTRGGYGGHQSSGGYGGHQSSGGYGGHQSSGSLSGSHRIGRSLVSSGYSGAGIGHVRSGSAIASSGLSGHRSGAVIPSAGYVAVAPAIISSSSYGHSGHRLGRSVSILPVISHVGVGRISGGYSQENLHGGHRYARSLVALSPVAGHGSYSDRPSSVENYGSYGGHGQSIVRSPVSAYGGSSVGHYSGTRVGSQRGYSDGGHQRSSSGIIHG